MKLSSPFLFPLSILFFLRRALEAVPAFPVRCVELHDGLHDPRRRRRGRLLRSCSSPRLPAAAAHGPPRPAARRPNVLLVTIDTLRADRVGCYGYAPRPSTPALDGLAARGVRFATAVAHVPLTAPSHASILTGRTPARPRRPRQRRLRPARRGPDRGRGLPAGRLPDRRPSSPASRSNRRFGFDRGFETYDDHLPQGNDPRRTRLRRALRRRAPPTPPCAGWRRRRGAAAPRPFFLWVHYYDPHAPYEPPGEFAARFAAAPYDGEVAFVDAQLGAAAAARSRRGARRAAPLVLVTADHGESLGEHGEGTHGIFVYDSTLRVPLIMAGPGIAAGRVAATVARGIDVAADAARLRRPRRAAEHRGALAAAARPTGERWTTRRPTPSRSTRSCSSAGRRSSPGAPRATR